MSDCNDYNYKLLQRNVHQPAPAPAPKELVHHTPHTQVNLPRATPAVQSPVPVKVVEVAVPTPPPADTAPVPPTVLQVATEIPAQGIPVIEQEGSAPASLASPTPMTLDEALDQLQPNRKKGFKSQITTKDGAKVPELSKKLQQEMSRNAEAVLPKAQPPVPCPVPAQAVAPAAPVAAVEPELV